MQRLSLNRNHREAMPGPEQLKPKDLVVGGRYLHVNRLFIRQIDGIEGDTVIYHDQYGHEIGRAHV